jgi:3-hydroxy acid dehydrogenase / malonic semialdehyde reductase
MGKIVLVTGATSGFGKAIATRFAKEGNDVIITGRRGDRLLALKNELEHLFGVEILALQFDVRVEAEVRNAVEDLPERWRNIDVLVNNAGLAAGLGPINEGVVDDWDRMIDTNIKGLLYMTRYISPLMVARKTGHIINIGSIAGKEVYPNGNVYCGTKFAVDAISKATRIDLVAHHIKVTQIAPGAAETEFSLVRFNGDADRAGNVYKGFTPLSGTDVAEVAHYVTTLPVHVNINDLVLMPAAQASSVVINKTT